MSSTNLELENQHYCTLCTELCYSKAIFVNNQLLDILKFIIGDMDTSALEDSTICDDCLNKIIEVYNFKSLFKQKLRIPTSDAESINEVTHCDKLIKCFICKNHVEPQSSLQFVDLLYAENVIYYIIPRNFMEKFDNPQICEICHTTLSNFDTIMTLLSAYIDTRSYASSRSTETSTSGKTCKKCHNVAQSGMRCISCDTVIHFGCVKYLKNVNIIDKDRVVCCSSPIDEVPVPDNDTLSFDTVEKLNPYKKESTIRKKPLIADDSVNENTIEIKVEVEICDEENSVSEDFPVIPEDSLKMNVQVNEQNGDYIQYDIEENSTMNHINFVANEQSSLPLGETHEDDNITGTFPCGICTFRAKFYSDLVQHDLVHRNPNEIKIYQCQMCTYQTQFKNNLKNHMKVHSHKKKLFKCPTCQFETQYRVSFVKHMLIHKHPEKYKMLYCDICKFQTRFKKSLEKHELLHLNSSDTVRYKCQHCDHETIHKEDHEKHMRIHQMLTSNKSRFEAEFQAYLNKKMFNKK